MVSVIIQETQGSSGHERVRWIEQIYATQMDQEAARYRGERFFNGGLMESVDG
jgi:hypothetical protein